MLLARAELGKLYPVVYPQAVSVDRADVLIDAKGKGALQQ